MPSGAISSQRGHTPAELWRSGTRSFPRQHRRSPQIRHAEPCFAHALRLQPLHSLERRQCLQLLAGGPATARRVRDFLITDIPRGLVCTRIRCTTTSPYTVLYAPFTLSNLEWPAAPSALRSHLTTQARTPLASTLVYLFLVRTVRAHSAAVLVHSALRVRPGRSLRRKTIPRAQVRLRTWLRVRRLRPYCTARHTCIRRPAHTPCTFVGRGCIPRSADIRQRCARKSVPRVSFGPHKLRHLLQRL